MLVNMNVVQNSKYYLTISPQNVREKPKDILEMARTTIPSESTGFLPMRSDIRPQNIIVARDASWETASWNKKWGSRTLTGWLTHHQASVIPNSLRISTCYRDKELICSWGSDQWNSILNMSSTSFKNGKMAAKEAASQNRARKRIDIWDRGRGVYFSDGSISLVVVGELGDIGRESWSWCGIVVLKW